MNNLIGSKEFLGKRSVTKRGGRGSLHSRHGLKGMVRDVEELAVVFVTLVPLVPLGQSLHKHLLKRLGPTIWKSSLSAVGAIMEMNK